MAFDITIISETGRWKEEDDTIQAVMPKTKEFAINSYAWRFSNPPKSPFVKGGL